MSREGFKKRNLHTDIIKVLDLWTMDKSAQKKKTEAGCDFLGRFFK